MITDGKLRGERTEAARVLQLATSFRRDEVDAMVSLFRALHEKRDVSAMLRGEPLRTAYGKFCRMRQKAEAAR